MSAPLAIEIKNITVVYNEYTSSEVVALNDFSLSVKNGELLAITGGNGTGKSTLLNAIAGHLPIKSGEIWLNGINVTNWSAAKRARLLSMIHQDPMLGTCPGLSLQENFQLVQSRRWWLPIPYSLRMSEAQKQNIHRTGVGAENRPSAQMSSLSGGQRQAVAICLAFENRKPIVLLDEFTSALSESTKTSVLTYTFEMAKKSGATIIMVTHSLADVQDLITNVIKF